MVDTPKKQVKRKKAPAKKTPPKNSIKDKVPAPEDLSEKKSTKKIAPKVAAPIPTKPKGVKPTKPKAPKPRAKKPIDWKKLGEQEKNREPEILETPVPPLKPEPQDTTLPPIPTPQTPKPQGVFPDNWYVKSRGYLIVLALLVLFLLIYKGADLYLNRVEEQPVNETIQLPTESPDEESYEEPINDPIVAPERLPEVSPQEQLPEKLPETSTTAPITPTQEVAPAIPQAPEPSPEPDQKIPPMPPVTPPVTKIMGTPKLAIVIDDMGLNGARLESLMNVGMPLTLSFLPYGRDAASMVQRARKRGFEILVHVPMEPLSKEYNAGPNTLRVSMDTVEIQRALHKNLNALEGYVGINNHMGSAFTEHHDKLAPVMEILKERGLIFLDSRTSPRSQGVAAAQAHGVSTLGRDVFIDNVLSVPTIIGHLNQAAKIAQKRGYAIAIGHPHLETIQALKQWKTPVTIVPLSALIQD